MHAKCYRNKRDNNHEKKNQVCLSANNKEKKRKKVETIQQRGGVLEEKCSVARCKERGRHLERTVEWVREGVRELVAWLVVIMLNLNSGLDVGLARRQRRNSCIRQTHTSTEVYPLSLSRRLQFREAELIGIKLLHHFPSILFPIKFESVEKKKRYKSRLLKNLLCRKKFHLGKQLATFRIQPLTQACVCAKKSLRAQFEPR